jgi:hypothetical protein
MLVLAGNDQLEANAAQTFKSHCDHFKDGVKATAGRWRLRLEKRAVRGAGGGYGKTT